MNQTTAFSIRKQLLDRKQRLEVVLSEVGEASDLVRLLREVDSALERMDGDSFGTCEMCGGSVSDELLALHPMIQYCLCDLTPAQERALERDLGLAWRIQSALLPRQTIEFAGWEVHYRYVPEGVVSGDVCDVVTRESGEGSLTFLLGDVSGKGVAASFLMAHLNALFRSLIDAPIRELVERANRIFSEATPSSHYATLVCGNARASGAVEILNAGHCPPFVVRAGDGAGGPGRAGDEAADVATVDSTGLPVGILESSPYEVQTVELSPGDTLFLYSDGLTEALNAAGEEYGIERLERFLRDHRRLRPTELAAGCLEDLSRFRSGAPRNDDLTIMAVRRIGPG